MAPIGGRPFLQILLDQLIEAGCGRVILSVGHMRQVIIETFGDGYRNLPIDYAIEDTPLGTGGAIQLALQQARESSVLILNGDTYLDANYSLMLSHHLNARSSMTMAVTRVGDIARYGGVVLEAGRVSSFLEKGNSGPGWINAGAYVLERDFPWPAQLASRFSFETDVLAPFVGQIHPVAFPCEGYFLDIGIPEDLDRAAFELSSKRTTD